MCACKCDNGYVSNEGSSTSPACERLNAGETDSALYLQMHVLLHVLKGFENSVMIALQDFGTSVATV